MVIQSSHAQMYAKTTKQSSYKQTKNVAMRNVMTGEVRHEKSEFSLFYGSESEHAQEEGTGLPETPPIQNVENMKPVSGLKDAFELFVKRLREYLQEIRNRLLSGLFSRVLYQSEQGLIIEPMYTLDLTTGSGLGNVSVWNRITETTLSYSETESMRFETTGKVVTADGREIEFGMELSMSRQFTETIHELKQDDVVAIMTDPLVIALDTDAVSISDRKWEFDIDADGVKDSISMLGDGAGYLAYDKNGDGEINDGSELFGSKTGNGFAELAEFDEDGNGWIDENDSVYNKLSVWVKNSIGRDELLSLKQAKVGAIYLGSQKTDYSMNSVNTNETNAMLRRTGFYLTESGVANSIQQFDMVKTLIS